MNLYDKVSKFLEKYDIKPKHETSRSYIFDCPSCGGKDKLYVQKQDGKSICFKGKDVSCLKPTDSLEFVLSNVSGLDIETVKSDLQSEMIDVGETVEISFTSEKKETPVLEPITSSDLPQDILPISTDASIDGRLYLEGRGIPLEMMKKYGVMYSSSLRRVIFPVIMDNKIYGWQGRSIDAVDKSLRMKNLPGEWKSKTLMFKDNLAGAEHAIIAEGAVSAMKFELAGGFVATMGKVISKEQLDIIKNSGIQKVYLALDRDAAESTAKLRDFFLCKSTPVIPCYLIEVPEHRDDFGECTFEECLEAFKGARAISKDEVFLYIEDK